MGPHRLLARRMATRPRTVAAVGVLVFGLGAWQIVRATHDPALPRAVGTATSLRSAPDARAGSGPSARAVVPRSPTRREVRAQVSTRVAALITRQPPGGVSVAAVNTRTGAHFSAGADSDMWTASVYKLFILEALLLEREDAGTTLSGEEDALAAQAIENSDNVAGYRLFLDAGGNAALASAYQRLGLTNTVPGASDPTFTRTSARDCLVLLRHLVRNGPLAAGSRMFTLRLMRNVEADQRWGVGVVADHGTPFANKNGWLAVDDTNGAGEADDGRWAVTSVGIVRVKHQQVLMAVLTQHQPSFDDGIRLVESLARAITPAVVS